MKTTAKQKQKERQKKLCCGVRKDEGNGTACHRDRNSHEWLSKAIWGHIHIHKIAIVING